MTAKQNLTFIISVSVFLGFLIFHLTDGQTFSRQRFPQRRLNQRWPPPYTGSVRQNRRVMANTMARSQPQQTVFQNQIMHRQRSNNLLRQQNRGQRNLQNMRLYSRNNNTPQTGNNKRNTPRERLNILRVEASDNNINNAVRTKAVDTQIYQRQKNVSSYATDISGIPVRVKSINQSPHQNQNQTRHQHQKRQHYQQNQRLYHLQQNQQDNQLRHQLIYQYQHQQQNNQRRFYTSNRQNNRQWQNSYLNRMRNGLNAPRNMVNAPYNKGQIGFDHKNNVNIANVMLSRQGETRDLRDQMIHSPIIHGSRNMLREYNTVHRKSQEPLNNPQHITYTQKKAYQAYNNGTAFNMTTSNKSESSEQTTVVTLHKLFSGNAGVLMLSINDTKSENGIFSSPKLAPKHIHVQPKLNSVTSDSNLKEYSNQLNPVDKKTTENVTKVGTSRIRSTISIDEISNPIVINVSKPPTTFKANDHSEYLKSYRPTIDRITLKYQETKHSKDRNILDLGYPELPIQEEKKLTSLKVNVDNNVLNKLLKESRNAPIGMFSSIQSSVNQELNKGQSVKKNNNFHSKVSFPFKTGKPNSGPEKGNSRPKSKFPKISRMFRGSLFTFGLDDPKPKFQLKYNKKSQTKTLQTNKKAENDKKEAPFGVSEKTDINQRQFLPEKHIDEQSVLKEKQMARSPSVFYGLDFPTFLRIPVSGFTDRFRPVDIQSDNIHAFSKHLARPSRPFGAGMFGYRKAGYEPPPKLEAVLHTSTKKPGVSDKSGKKTVNLGIENQRKTVQTKNNNLDIKTVIKTSKFSNSSQSPFRNTKQAIPPENQRYAEQEQTNRLLSVNRSTPQRVKSTPQRLYSNTFFGFYTPTKMDFVDNVTKSIVGGLRTDNVKATNLNKLGFQTHDHKYTTLVNESFLTSGRSNTSNQLNLKDTYIKQEPVRTSNIDHDQHVADVETKKATGGIFGPSVLIESNINRLAGEWNQRRLPALGTRDIQTASHLPAPGIKEQSIYSSQNSKKNITSQSKYNLASWSNKDHINIRTGSILNSMTNVVSDARKEPRLITEKYELSEQTLNRLNGILGIDSDIGNHINLERSGKNEIRNHINLERSGKNEIRNHINLERSGKNEIRNHINLERSGKHERRNHINLERSGKNEIRNHINLERSGKNETRKSDKITAATTLAMQDKSYQFLKEESKSSQNHIPNLSNRIITMFGENIQLSDTNNHQESLSKQLDDTAHVSVQRNIENKDSMYPKEFTSGRIGETINTANILPYSFPVNENKASPLETFTDQIRMRHSHSPKIMSSQTISKPIQSNQWHYIDSQNRKNDNKRHGNDNLIGTPNIYTEHVNKTVSENKGNETYIQTLSKLVDSISITELKDVISQFSSSNQTDHQNKFVNDYVGQLTVTDSLLNDVKENTTFYRSTVNNNTPSFLLRDADSKRDQHFDNVSSIPHEQAQTESLSKQYQHLTQTDTPNMQTMRSAPKMKIGNIKVNSFHSFPMIKAKVDTGIKTDKAVVAPYLSKVDFGVVIESKKVEPKSTGTYNIKTKAQNPISSVPANTNTLLDDLLTGLNLLLNTDMHTSTYAPPTTSETSISQICDYTSPKFKCKGKGMFTTVDTMITWCLDQCKSDTGCLDTVCDCGCDAPKQEQKQVANNKRLKNKQNAKKPNNDKLIGKQKKPSKIKIRKLLNRKHRGQRRNKQSPIVRKQSRRHGKQGLRRGKHSIKRGQAGLRHGNRRLLSNSEKQKQEQKPKPTTEEPPEIEWEDIVSTTTAMPSSTEDYNYELGSTISPFDDIKLQQVNEQDVRAERIHIKEIPQVHWASETRARLAKLVKNTAKINKADVWQDIHVTTTYQPYPTTMWEYTTTSAPIHKPGWPTVRPIDNWTTRGWRDRPAARLRGRSGPARGARRNSWSQPTTPPSSWHDTQPRYNPPPTYRPRQNRARWGNNDWSNRAYPTENYRHNRGWGGPNYGLRNRWGSRQNNGVTQEPTEAPDK